MGIEFILLLFLILVACIYYILFYKKLKIDANTGKTIFYVMLGAGLLLRLLIAPKIEGFSSDINCFKAWAIAASKNLTGFYNTGMFCDYPPLYIFVLFLVGKIAGLAGIINNGALFTLAVKLPSIAADLVTTYFLYTAAKKNLSREFALFIAAFYVFNPAVFINSTVWGQVDSFFTMIIVAALLCLVYERINYASILFVASVLMKPQGLIFLPILLFELVKRRNVKNILTAAVYGIATALLIIMPFSRDPFWIFNLFIKTASGYKYASLNAFNFFSLIGANLKPDSEKWFILSYNTWGNIFFLLVNAFTFFLYLKGKDRKITFLAALIQITGVFMLWSRMHERYLFPAIALGLMSLVYMKDKRFLPLTAGISITIFLNTYVVLYRMLKLNYPHVPPNDAVLLCVSLVNLLLLGYLVKISVDILIKSRTEAIVSAYPDVKNKPEAESLPLKSIDEDRKGDTFLQSNNDIPQTTGLKPDKKDIIIMVSMTLIYLVISLICLGDINVPKTSWKPAKSGESFIIDLGRETQLSKVYYYCGFGTGTSLTGKYRILYLAPSGGYQPYAIIEKKDIFIWKTVNTPDIKVSKLKVIADDTGGNLNEIGLFEKGSNIPVKGIKIVEKSVDPEDVGTVENLFDEQSKIDFKHSFMSGMIFDEIYHARTAYEFLNRIEPYEWTHPPLGKIFISLGIAIFGMDPFGWRIIGTLFGVAMVPIMYLFGRKVFGQRFYAFCTAFLIMFDFMHFSLTRIATIDVYGTFFIILMYYFMYDYFTQKSYLLGFKKSIHPLFCCGLFFGMGAASKWIGVYAGGGLALLLFLQKYSEYRDYRNVLKSEEKGASWVKSFIPLYINRTLLCCVLFFVIIPSVIYILSYTPYMLVPGPGHGFDVILRNQFDMYNYHSKGVLGATHPFSSYWWEWPLIRKPLETYLGSDLPAGRSSSMTIMGNPAIWWIGIAAVLFICIMAFIKCRNKLIPSISILSSLILIVAGNGILLKLGVLVLAITVLIMVIIFDKKLAVIFTAMAFQYLPWVGVKRIAFIYHFFSVVPFLILAIVYVIKYILEKYPDAKHIIYTYLLVVAVMFVMFYPVLSGMEVSRWYVNNFLLWFSGRWFF